MNNVRFKQRAQLLVVGVITLAVSLVFTGCPVTGGGGTPQSYAITFGVDGGNGTLKAKADGITETATSPITVEKGKTVTFTAVPDDASTYEVDAWTISGGSFSSGGINGSTAAEVTVGNTNLTVKVTFKTKGTTPPAAYVQVPYENLETYLRDTASSSGVNYIEVTGDIPKEDFKGNPPNPGALGQKLKAHPDKKVALKIAAYPEGLTDMSYCFAGCTNLISVQNIPEDVKNMNRCFNGCTGLTTVPAIPESVTDMGWCFEGCTSLTGVTLKCNYSAGNFDSAFTNCTALQNGGIKVPAGELETYQNNAETMGTTREKFAAEGGIVPPTPLDGVWKALSMTTVVGGMTTTGNFPAPYEDPDDASNTDATMQLYMCFYEGKMYMAAKYSGMSNPAKNGLFLNSPGAPYSLSGNTLSVGSDTSIVSFPSAGSLELKMTKEGTDTTMQLEKTSDYTAEQIKNAPPEEP